MFRLIGMDGSMDGDVDRKIWMEEEKWVGMISRKMCTFQLKRCL